MLYLQNQQRTEFMQQGVNSLKTTKAILKCSKKLQYKCSKPLLKLKGVKFPKPIAAEVRKWDFICRAFIPATQVPCACKAISVNCCFIAAIGWQSLLFKATKISPITRFHVKSYVKVLKSNLGSGSENLWIYEIKC